MRENETVQLLPGGPHGMGGHPRTGRLPAGERLPDGSLRRPVPRELAALRIFYRQTRRVASSAFSRTAKFATRAAEAAALFFTANNHFNRPQTEP